MGEGGDRSPLRRGFRDALPLLGAQGIVFLAGFALSAVLLQLLSREDLAHFGRMREALRWLVVIGGFGLATGLLRDAREHRGRRASLLVTTWIAGGALSVIAMLAFVLTPFIRELTFGNPVTEEEFLLFGWKAPFIVLFAATMAVLHAGGRFGRMGGLESGERGFVLTCTVIGALAGGLRGLVIGSLAASVLAAAISAGFARREVAGDEGRARFDPSLLGRLFRVGWARTCVQLLETLRRLALLRLLTTLDVGEGEIGLLVAGMLFTLPLIAVPERLAQALYPSMLDENGEAADLDRHSRRFLLELAAIAVPFLLAVGGILTVLLPIFKGGEYADAVPIVWILLPGVVAHGLAAHPGYVILVRNRLPLEAMVSAIALAATLALAWLLAPGLGAVGGAIALSGALVIRGVLITLVAHRPG